MRYFFFSVALLCPWLLGTGELSAQVRVPGRSAARQPNETVKIGQLQRGGGQANRALYMLHDGVQGGQVLVRSAGDLDLEEYLDQDVVLHGKFQPTGEGRRQVFVVERVVPMEEDAEQPVEESSAAENKGRTRPANYQQDALSNPFSDRRLARQPGAMGQPPTAAVDVMPGAGGDFMHPAYGPYDPSYGAPQGPGETYWIRGEYLLWGLDGMDLPPLVTTSVAGTNRPLVGVLGEANTSILYGGDEVNEDTASGFRIQGGFWMNPAHSIGLEGEYFSLGEISEQYSATSTGNPFLARPFFDATAGRETAGLVAFPNLIRGTVAVDTSTEVQGAGGRFRFNLCNGQSGCCDNGACGSCGGSGYRADWLAGYRYLRLEDSVIIREDSVSLETANPGSFAIRDEFFTRNEFHGADIGAVYAMYRGPWVMELLTKVAVGQNRQLVQIAGNSNITENGTTSAFNGGLLAQRTNIGTFEQEEIAVVPEIGINLGYQINPSWRILAGYSLVYFSNVVRAGDQIDLDVNPNLLPPEASPFTGPLRPQFAFDTTDFYMHGLNVGLDFRR